jgi:hypothetical protein
LQQDPGTAAAARNDRRQALAWLGAAAMALATLLAPGPASAKDLPDGGFTTADVVAWLQASGDQAQLVPAHDGIDTHVQALVDGREFGVYMFDCKDDRCGSIEFSAGWPTHGTFDTSRMNKWNRENRWARGYFDTTNDPWVEMDVDLTPGGTYELLDDELGTWMTALKRFTDLYGLK